MLIKNNNKKIKMKNKMIMNKHKQVKLVKKAKLAKKVKKKKNKNNKNKMKNLKNKKKMIMKIQNILFNKSSNNLKQIYQNMLL